MLCATSHLRLCAILGSNFRCVPSGALIIGALVRVSIVLTHELRPGEANTLVPIVFVLQAASSLHLCTNLRAATLMLGFFGQPCLVRNERESRSTCLCEAWEHADLFEKTCGVFCPVTQGRLAHVKPARTDESNVPRGWGHRLNAVRNAAWYRCSESLCCFNCCTAGVFYTSSSAPGARKSAQ